MKDEGRSQVWLAGRIGKDQADVSRIVNGRLVPTDIEKAAIAKALGREVDDVWGARVAA